MLRPSKLPASVTPVPLERRHRRARRGGGAARPSSTRRSDLPRCGRAVGESASSAEKKPPSRVAQVAQHVLDRLVEHLPVPRLAGDLPGVQIDAGEQRLVVEHLLEVGHQPRRRRPSSGRSRPRGGRRCRPRPWRRAWSSPSRACARRRCRAMGAQQQLERSWSGGNFGGPRTHPSRGRSCPVSAVVSAPPASRVDARDRRSPAGSVAPRRSMASVSSSAWPSRSSRRVCQTSSIRPSSSVKLIMPRPAHRREVGAAEEGAAVGRQEHRHRPSALAGHGLHGVHVDGVDVGSFFAVDLDADEPLVHQRGGRGGPRTTRAP